MATFTVDTQLFRELGELLVGRDSTALTELIKNAYDADATLVSVTGERLEGGDHGSIYIVDNGVGMTGDQFRVGYLTIAGRGKRTTVSASISMPYSIHANAEVARPGVRASPDPTGPLEERVAFLEDAHDRATEAFLAQGREIEAVRDVVASKVSTAVTQVRQDLSQQRQEEEYRLSRSLDLQGRGLYFLFAGLFLSLMFNLVC